MNYKLWQEVTEIESETLKGEAMSGYVKIKKLNSGD